MGELFPLVPQLFASPGVDGGVRDFVLLPELIPKIGGVCGGVCKFTCFCCHDVGYDGGPCGTVVGVVGAVDGADGATAV